MAVICKAKDRTDPLHFVHIKNPVILEFRQMDRFHRFRGKFRKMRTRYLQQWILRRRNVAQTSQPKSQGIPGTGTAEISLFH